ncbi:MAG: YciI family protein [Hyphomonadaceae bacterium]
MRVMVFGKAVEDSAPPTPEAFAAMDQFIEDLVKAGVFVAAAGLKNNAQAKRIACDGPRRTVLDGPFAESKELVLGFAIWEVKDMDDADGLGGAAIRMSAPARPKSKFALLRSGGLGRVSWSPEERAALHDGERGKLGVA